MRYLGGKSRLSKNICTFLNESLRHKESFYEPFVGAFNIVPNMILDNKSVLCSDLHDGLITMYNDILNGWLPPKSITEEEYKELKKHKNRDALSTFVSFACSFGGREWEGYARGYGRDFCLESYNAIVKKFNNIPQNIKFKHQSYLELDVYNSTIYCDPPYKDTKKYKNDLVDYNQFYEWCEKMKSQNNDVFVSEFQAPSHWTIVWQKERKITCTTSIYNTKVDKLFLV